MWGIFDLDEIELGDDETSKRKKTPASRMGRPGLSRQEDGKQLVV